MMEIISNLLLWDTLQHWSPFSEIITVVSFRITLSDLLSYLTIFLTFSLHFLGWYLYVPVSTQLGFHCKLLRLSRPEFCEMKYFLPYQSARSVTAISHFGAPHVNEGSQRGTQCLRPSRCHHPPRWLLRSLGGVGRDTGSSHWPQLPPLMVNKKLRIWTIKKQDLAPDSWGAYERNEFSEPRGCIYSRTLNSLAWYLVFLT